MSVRVSADSDVTLAVCVCASNALSMLCARTCRGRVCSSVLVHYTSGPVKYKSRDALNVV